jgi:hypothetical protein
MDVKRNDCGLIGGTILAFDGKTEEKHKKPQDTQFPAKIQITAGTSMLSKRMDMRGGAEEDAKRNRRRKKK